jgi:UPF0755 protein
VIFGRRKDTKPPATQDTGYGAQPRLSPRSPSEAIKPTMAPAPPPPRVRPPRGGLLSTLSGLLTLALVLAVGVLLGVVLLSRQAHEAGPLASDKVVVIPKNTGTSEIAEILRREGVIAQPFLFEVYALLNRQRGQLKAGEFAFKARTSIDSAINTLVEGRAILHTFTVPEGLTSEQIVARMAENEILTGDVTQMPREGALLPDTYKFERGTSRQQLIALMQAKQREALNQIWQRRAQDLPIKTPQELVILASIVEKETGRADERTRVAGVFINRLTRKMRLQSDPTIVYGLVGGKGTLGRGILRSEIDKPTPYNTYAVDGLPPGPIANPGRAAMEAVANPSRTKDLFFVADGSGGHAFSETYEQHQRQVARWRQVERTRQASGRPAEEQVDRAEPISGPEAGSSPASAFTAPGAPPAAFPGQPNRRPDGGQPGRPGGTGPRTDLEGGAGPALPGDASSFRAIDASEGTNLDPLRNRNFDLNSPQTVPQLTQYGRTQPTAQPPRQRARDANATPPRTPPRRAAEQTRQGSLPPGVQQR